MRHRHALPTATVARYTAGPWVGKFLETCTCQPVLTDEVGASIGESASRMCRLERVAGYARQADVRMRRCGGRHVPYAAAAE